MAAPTSLTLLDLAKRTNNNKVMDVAEVLDRKIPLIRMMPFFPSTDLNSHTVARRGSLPTGTWRQMGEYVSPNKSDVVQIKEPIGELVGWSEMDSSEYDIAPDKKAYRKMEDLAHVEGMSQQLETALFYQSLADDPASIDGLATRYSAIATDSVYDVGGDSDGDQSSIWVCELGPHGLYGIYPKESKEVGLNVELFPKERTVNSSGAIKEVYRSKFTFRIGLAIKDTRAVKRIANIDATEAAVTTALDSVSAAINRLPGHGQRVILVSQTIRDYLEQVTDAKTNVRYLPESPFGFDLYYFKGVPIFTCEKLLATEDELS